MYKIYVFKNMNIKTDMKYRSSNVGESGWTQWSDTIFLLLDKGKYFFYGI